MHYSPNQVLQVLRGSKWRVVSEGMLLSPHQKVCNRRHVGRFLAFSREAIFH